VPFYKIAEKMAAWKKFFVPKKVLEALCDSEFYAPTPIQAMALPSAIRDRKDIVGAAETVRRTTDFYVLPFIIPSLHNWFPFIIFGTVAHI
jgi:ATP-dependent RNA helicase DDX24/MAK5